MRPLRLEGWSTLFAAIACAVAGLVVLLVAIFMGSPLLAATAIGIATAGAILLSRDWRRERSTAATGAEADRHVDGHQAAGDPSPRGLAPELFTPDVSYEEAVQEVDDDEELDLDGNT